ncbi:MAG: hypothetical protein GC160_08040 [Acidobacteria bacterium]|nr:hypothetical protein [Acidobacteriota bacterium]
MPIRPEDQADIDAMPPALRELIEAELAAGNDVVEVGHSFPAPPVGCYVQLARPVQSRPRASSEGVSFYDRNTSRYSGEYTDPKRWYFVLEPPHAPEPEPDMDAIRAAASASAATVAATHVPVAAAPPAPPPVEAAPRATAAGSTSLLERFRRSMTMDYEKFHDGVGYDLDLLDEASPEERGQIERLLLSRGVQDWRDVEALAALDTPKAQAKLREALQEGDSQIQVAVLNYAPELAGADDRTAALVAALETAEFYGGLTQAMTEAEEFHPPAVVDALFRGVLRRSGEIATNFAALLMYVHDKAEEPFDWELRPFFLEFNTDDMAERRRWFLELCDRLEVDAEQLLARLE